jgi:hypothetical protein
MRERKVVMIGSILEIKMEADMKVVMTVEVTEMAKGVENGGSPVARISIITITMVPLNETETGAGRIDEMMNQRKMNCGLKRKI